MSDNQHEAHKEAKMFDTEEELIELCKTISSGEAEPLGKGEFSSKFVWIDETKGPRLFMFPFNDEEQRDDFLKKIYFALTTLSSVTTAKYLAFAIDSYQSKTATKHDGSQWGPNDMGYAFENKTVDADLVYECFTITISDRAGWNAIVSVPYYRDGVGGVLFDWDNVTTLIEANGSGASGGAYPVIMGQAMQAPHILDSAEVVRTFAELLGLDDERRDMHLLCVAVKKVMTDTGFPCAIPAWTPVERDALTSSFSQDGEFTTEYVEP